MLSGEPLKRIAEKTMIPKRNLIRWKHEFLHAKRHLRLCDDRESVELDECEETDVKKDISESREVLTAESLDLIRLQ